MLQRNRVHRPSLRNFFSMFKPKELVAFDGKTPLIFCHNPRYIVKVTGHDAFANIGVLKSIKINQYPTKENSGPLDFCHDQLLSLYYVSKDNFDQALKHAEKFRQLAEGHKSKSREAYVYTSSAHGYIGDILLAQGKTDLAFQHFFRAKEISTECKHNGLEADRDLICAYIYLKQTDKALDLINQLCNKFENASLAPSDYTKLAWLYSVRAICHALEHRAEQAIQDFDYVGDQLLRLWFVNAHLQPRETKVHQYNHLLMRALNNKTPGSISEEESNYLRGLAKDFDIELPESFNFSSNSKPHRP